MKEPLKTAFSTLLRGMGQIMLQNNPNTGILFLLGLVYSNWLMGVAALIGLLTSTYTAKLLKYNEDDIRNGLFGFNGALVGIGIVTFYGPQIIVGIILIVAAAASSILMQVLKKHLPPFTFPFVLVAWIGIYLLKLLHGPLAINTSLQLPSFNFAAATLNSFGQVMFQEQVITGFIFLVALFIHSKVATAYALGAAFLSLAFGWLLGAHFITLNSGLLGYNAILCGIALSGEKLGDIISAFIAVLLSVVIQIELPKVGIATLTAPFVFATWLVLAIRSKLFLYSPENPNGQIQGQKAKNEAH